MIKTISTDKRRTNKMGGMKLLKLSIYSTGSKKPSNADKTVAHTKYMDSLHL